MNLSKSSINTTDGVLLIASVITLLISLTNSPLGLSFLKIYLFLFKELIKELAHSVLPTPAGPYKNKFLGNNSNTGNLIRSLPLSEYGYVFEIDSKKLGLTIDYHITDWYINGNYYLEKSLVYNSIAIFSLIDNIQYIKYNFSGNTYTVDRENVEKYFPHFFDIKNNKESFNKYLENKINDIDFVDMYFNKIIS